MTCKDCVHYEVCKKYEIDIQVNFYEQEFNEQEFINDGICSSFRDKSRLIALPCKAGDYIYFTTKTNNHFSTIKFGRVYEICINSNDNLFLGVVEYDEYDDIVAQWDISECQWGKTVFLTREEAEKALKEREINA